MKLHLITTLLIFLLVWPVTTQAQKKLNTHMTKGLTSINDFGINAGIGNYTLGKEDKQNSETVITLSSVISYMFNSHFSAGVGLGFDKWKLINFLPVYVDLRLFFLSSYRTNPFIFIDGGFARKWGTSPRSSAIKFSAGSTGDFFGAAGIGVKTYISKSSCINFSFGYKIQRINLSYLGPNNIGSDVPVFLSEIANYQFLSIKAGFSF